MDDAASAKKGALLKKLWSFLKNRKTARFWAWLGGGVIVLAGVWVAVTLYYSYLEEPALLQSEVAPDVIASRIFAGPNQYPPIEFAAYGILAFRSRPSPYDRERHLMFCNAYVAILPHAAELDVPRSKQMVTVWPLVSDEHSDPLNRFRSHVDNVCQIAVDNYGLVIAQQALKDAELTGKKLDRTGPFLLAWSPSSDKGKQDALVLVSDLSDIATYEQAQERFLAWSRDIESDPTLWMSGWDLERLRTYIRNWVDKYGEKSLAVFAR